MGLPIPTSGVFVAAAVSESQSSVLTPEAQAFVAVLHRAFEARRRALLAARDARQADWDVGAVPDFLPTTAAVRADPTWRGAPPAAGLEDRRVEITGPPERWVGGRGRGAGVRALGHSLAPHAPAAAAPRSAASSQAAAECAALRPPPASP